MSEAAQAYVGRELDNFSIARNWKSYWTSRILPYLGKSVLEVGAGIGSSTWILASVWRAERWVCLEPDPGNIRALRARQAQGQLPKICEVRQGTLASLAPDERFDSILYIDVLEHIEDDRGEIESAGDHISLGGHLIILAPAYPFLFSEFDRSIGHYRRYTRHMFADHYGASLRRVVIRNLDSAGLLASLANRWVLRSSLPTKTQLYIWDRFLIPVSRIVDWLGNYRFGRSILVVYEKVAEDPPS